MYNVDSKREECGNRGDETFMFVKEWHCKVLLAITPPCRPLNTEYTHTGRKDVSVLYLHSMEQQWSWHTFSEIDLVSLLKVLININLLWSDEQTS